MQPVFLILKEQVEVPAACNCMQHLKKCVQQMKVSMPYI